MFIMNWLKSLFSKGASPVTPLPPEVEQETLREQALLVEARKQDANWSDPVINDYEEEINEYFKVLFPHRETKVFHEILSHSFHVDIHVLYPTEEEPFYVLHTSGMSTLPMTLPPDLLQDYGYLNRAELMMFLPASWNFGAEDTLSSHLPPEVFWPISTMAYMARLPHEHKSWIGYGLTLPNGEHYEPFASNTKLCGIALVGFDGNLGELTTKEGTRIQIYTLIALHKEELLFKEEHDIDTLMERILQETKGSFILDIHRNSAISPKEIRSMM